MAVTVVPVPTSLYQEGPSHAGGLGAFAIAPIPSGTRILCEPPLFTLPDDEDPIACYMVIRALSPDQQAAFWALASSTKPIRDRDWVDGLRQACNGT